MSKILGIDLGTGSIGLSERNTDIGTDVSSQLEYFTSVIFKSGVGEGKTRSEFSFAAQRTAFVSKRRLYKVRRYRKWATLALLIEYKLCPLSEEGLRKWSRYDKANGYFREYPIDEKAFECWIRLDFNQDGIADYTSPYHLRAELMNRQIDMDVEEDRFLLGRALYHIAQRRGFKSSKGESISAAEEDESVPITSSGEEEDMSSQMKASEEKTSGALKKYMEDNHLTTAGCAFYDMEKRGMRIRGTEYKAVRLMYKDEIEQIFSFQDALRKVEYKSLRNRLLSEKKGEGTIFYKRPLRSQKSNIGKCTLEPDKYRCPISHPEFERFRAMAFINNIKYRPTPESQFRSLPLETKRALFDAKFLLCHSDANFEDLKKWLSKQPGFSLAEYNYKDKTSVSLCPVSARLKNILGDDWMHATIKVNRSHTDYKGGGSHPVGYNYEDLWHLCFSSDDAEYIQNFASQYFSLNEAKAIMALWNAIHQGYAMLSLKAIRNINRFLEKGLIYSHAVMLAKLPDIFGEERWNEVEDDFLNGIDAIICDFNSDRKIKQLVNTLIAKYKSDNIAYKDTSYLLDESDYKKIEDVVSSDYGKETWKAKSAEERNLIIEKVAALFQQYLSSSARKFYNLPNLAGVLKDYIKERYPDVNKKKLEKIYHPSMISIYPPAKDDNGVPQLGSPVTGSFKNPMAMRILHVLRRQINDLLRQGIIDEDTRIVVEMAREVNDANMKWAIETYNKQREEENKVIREAIKKFCKGREVNDDDIDKGRLLSEQPLYGTVDELKEFSDQYNIKYDLKRDDYNKMMKKYRLWLEQDFRCIYTGEMISLSNLFNDEVVDIEHTIPRSISFDDSLSNKTVCMSYYNRHVKKNRLPYQLDYYEKIENNIKPWQEKIKKLREQVIFWKKRSRNALTVEDKDFCVRHRHLWELELQYWEKKVKAFTAKEVPSGFRNNQLNDTRIITKYAYHYLRTIFKNVDTINGGCTAEFRKIFGIQGKDEKKDRSNHSHHAIDATVLTLIPPQEKRNEMLKLYYEKEETKRFGYDVNGLQDSLDKEILDCGIRRADKVVEYIEKQILVNHVQRDNTFRKGKKVVNEAKKWISGGDSIRCNLHKDTLYGVIKYPKVHDDGNGGKIPERKNGKYVYESGEKSLYIVYRVKLSGENFSSLEDLDSIIDYKLREHIKAVVRKRMETNEKLSFKAALEQPIWTRGDGEEKCKAKNKIPLNPIRHVRCRAKGGRGYLTKVLEIRKNLSHSSKELINLDNRGYKRYQYAANSLYGYYLCLLYEDGPERSYRLLSYYDIVKLKINEAKIWNDENYSRNLKAVIKVGTRVLMQKYKDEDIRNFKASALNERLFVVDKFNKPSSTYIYLTRHIVSECSTKYVVDFSRTNGVVDRLMLTAANFNALIENVDFKVNIDGTISFIKK